MGRLILLALLAYLVTWCVLWLLVHATLLVIGLLVPPSHWEHSSSCEFHRNWDPVVRCSLAESLPWRSGRRQTCEQSSALDSIRHACSGR